MKKNSAQPRVGGLRSKYRSEVRRKIKRTHLAALILAFGIITAVAGNRLLTGVAAGPVQDSSADGQISLNAQKQIQALVAEKMSRTPAQKKIDSQLIYAGKMARGESIAAGVQSLAVNVEANGNRVVVDINGNINDALLEVLSANGAQILVSTPDYGTLRAEVGLDRLEAIAASPDVRYIQPKQEALVSRRATNGPSWKSGPPATRGTGDFAVRAARVRSNLSKALNALADDDSPGAPGAGTNVGARQSQGVVTHRVDVARSRYGVDGTGLKIGVLSDGVVNLPTAQASGDLPSDVTVLPGQVGQGDEGTAMLEIIHDMAPGAKLYFATAFSSIGSFADNIRKLRLAGCDIIVDDIFYFAEAPLQDGQAPAIVSNTNGGIVTQAVNDVTAAGALYFSSAGNEGNLNDGTAGVYEGDFVNGGTIALIGGAGAGPVHDFDPTAAVSQFDRITLGSANPVTLAWSDPLGASANDYDLYVLNAAGTALVAASTGSQDGTQDPFEAVGGGANVTNNRIVVAKFSGADRYIHVNTFRGRLQFATAGQTHGHSAAAEAYSVAATPVFGPFPQPFNSTNVVETFESDGPRRLFFQPNGTPYTPGNFSSTGGILRQKPDITAADNGVVSGAGGFPNPFGGTSAAAPHAAAIAALLKQARPLLTNAQIRAALIASAIDIEAPGVDRDSGAGIIMADTAIQAGGGVPVEIEVGTVTATEAAGNGNGIVEPGEKGSLSVQLRNNTAGTLSNISSTLTTNTPGVTIVPPGTSAYANIVSGGTGTNTTPFQFVVSSSVTFPNSINFTLTVNATGATSPKVLNFTVALRRTVSFGTTLDNVVPSGGEGFTAATGLQTGRLVRTAFGSNSSCGINKANPNVNAADATVPHRYDAYTFQNNSALPVCITVTLTTANADAGLLQSVAYAPTFNPAVVNDNYLGDIAGNQGNVGTRSYSFTVSAGSSFVVVVNEITGGGGPVPYTLTVEGLPVATAVPPLVTVQFASAATALVEASTSINLQVNRSGDTSFPVSVNYATVNGTASSLSDYGAAAGTLNFAAGQTSATISVLINEDSKTEGNETFTVVLSNPQGIEVAVGATNVETVTIQDDPVEPATNAIDDTETFVRQHYHDFLNREPDAAGLAFWINQIDSCPNAQCKAERRIAVSASFFLSIEFQETGYTVYRTYTTAFGPTRIGGTVPLTFQEFLPDVQRIGRGIVVGVGSWEADLNANKIAYFNEFVQRPAFIAQYPANTNPAQFVDALNSNSGNALSFAERNALVAELVGNNTNAGRASVLRQTVDDADLKASQFNKAFVLMEYFGYLQRNPNDAPDGNFSGYNFWLNKLNAAGGNFINSEMVKAFVTSNEYRQRFGN